MKYRLRTLMIVLALAPPVLAVLYFVLKPLVVLIPLMPPQLLASRIVACIGVLAIAVVLFRYRRMWTPPKRATRRPQLRSI